MSMADYMYMVDTCCNGACYWLSLLPARNLLVATAQEILAGGYM